MRAHQAPRFPREARWPPLTRSCPPLPVTRSLCSVHSDCTPGRFPCPVLSFGLSDQSQRVALTWRLLCCCGSWGSEGARPALQCGSGFGLPVRVREGSSSTPASHVLAPDHNQADDPESLLCSHSLSALENVQGAWLAAATDSRNQYLVAQVFHAYYKPLEFTVAERDASQCYIKVRVLGGQVGACQGVREREKVGPGGGGAPPHGHTYTGGWSTCSPGSHLQQTAADNVAFRWCACGSPQSWCWACTSWAPMQVKLLKDLLWGSSKSERMQLLLDAQTGVPVTVGSTTVNVRCVDVAFM